MFNLFDVIDDLLIVIEIGLCSSFMKVGLIGFGLMSCVMFGEVIVFGICYLLMCVLFFLVWFV